MNTFFSIEWVMHVQTTGLDVAIKTNTFSKSFLSGRDMVVEINKDNFLLCSSPSQKLETRQKL